MPFLARLYIKTGLVYLVVALLLGVLLASQAPLQLPPAIVALRPVYLHLLIVGWITQLIFGVVYWMFPKFSKLQPRGNERLAWAVFICLNSGLLLRAVGEPLVALKPELGAGGLLALAALLQVVAGWLFIATAWPRVKER